MCGPWLIPLALMAGGSVAQYFGNKQAEHAQNRTYQSERRRQQAFTNEQQGLFEDSLARAGNVADPAAERAATDHRESSLAAVIAPPSGAYLPGSSSANPVVRTASDRASGQRAGDSAALANALARLTGTGDQLLDANIMSGRNAGRIGQIGSFMSGSARAGEAELEAAAHKGSFLRGAGQLAQIIGQAMAGAPGAGGAGAAKGASKLAPMFAGGGSLSGTPFFGPWDLGG